VVEQIGPPGGQPSFTFKPEVRGQLPVSAQNLETIQQAMVSVADNRRGTAYLVFGSFPIAFAGKTGTAQDTPRDPHAWFAGYTFEERPDKPDIAVAVIAENAGQGSEIAAPICKRVLEIYFYGRPLSLYPWESQIGVPRPEPEATETPSPEG
jgi:cell division protein FtsI/penicillin-binding protein 2